MVGTINDKGELRQIAHCLCELGAGRVQLNETSEYFSLDVVESGPNKNAVGIHKEYVSFYITKDELKERVRKAGLDFHAIDEVDPKDIDKFRFYKLRVDIIGRNESLFKDLIDSSAEAVEKRRHV